jgi:hypothetical protein
MLLLKDNGNNLFNVNRFRKCWKWLKVRVIFWETDKPNLLCKLLNWNTQRETIKYSQYHFVNSTQTTIAILSISIRLYPFSTLHSFSLSFYTFPHMCSWIYSVWVWVCSYILTIQIQSIASMLYERERELIFLINNQHTLFHCW